MHEKAKKAIGVMVLGLLGSAAFATPAMAGETLRYNWRLRGALSWIARVKFPTSGTGVLRTQPAGNAVESQLRVSAGGHDYIEYVSRMDANEKTLTSANGYSLGTRFERKETVYDYEHNLARLAEKEQDKTDSRTRPLTTEIARDALTTIAWLREHAATVAEPLTTDVYADGKPYRVRIEPNGMKTMEWQGRNVQTRVFKIVSAPGAKKKFPGLTVWLTEDAQRVPLRIVFDQPYGASIDLRLNT